MDGKIQTVLYIDIQTAKPLARCDLCGGEIYGWDGFCLGCEMMAYDPA